MVDACFQPASPAANHIRTGGTVYTRALDIKLLKDPDLRAPVIGLIHLAGTPVVWLGFAPGNRAFHRIRRGAHEGYTLGQNLSPRNPLLSPDLWKDICPGCHGSGRKTVPLVGACGWRDEICWECGGTGVPRIDSRAYSSSGATKA